MRHVELPNYTPNEGECRCGCGMALTDDMVLRLQAFVLVLQRFYGARVRHIITSGARCPAHNAATPRSSPNSRHVGGNACDGVFEYLNRGKWHRIDNSDVAAAAVKTGLFGGVGYLEYARDGRDLVHLDNREGPCVTW